MLLSLAAHYGFDIEQPWEALDDEIQERVLHGSGEEAIAFNYPNARGRHTGKRHPFEGVIPGLERRWRETDTAVVREELSRLRTRHACPDCHGARLRSEALHVMIGDTPIHALSALPMARSS